MNRCHPGPVRPDWFFQIFQRVERKSGFSANLTHSHPLVAHLIKQHGCYGFLAIDRIPGTGGGERSKLRAMIVGSPPFPMADDTRPVRYVPFSNVPLGARLLCRVSGGSALSELPNPFTLTELGAFNTILIPGISLRNMSIGAWLSGKIPHATKGDCVLSGKDIHFSPQFPCPGVMFPHHVTDQWKQSQWPPKPFTLLSSATNPIPLR